MRTCNSCSVSLMEVISSSSGNGSNGVVDILLRLLLKMNEESVASFHHITKGSPKSRMSQLYAVVNIIAFIREQKTIQALFVVETMQPVEKPQTQRNVIRGGRSFLSRQRKCCDNGNRAANNSPLCSHWIGWRPSPADEVLMGELSSLNEREPTCGFLFCFLSY